MTSVLHIVPGLNEQWSGIAVAAKLLAKEQGAELVEARSVNARKVSQFDEIWVHSTWSLPVWRACHIAKSAGKKLVRMTHGNLDPVRLDYHGFKKRLAGPIERYFLRLADVVVATCEAEKGWVADYLGNRCPRVEVMDLKRFFDLDRVEHVDTCRTCSKDESVVFNAEKQSCREAEKDSLHLLYLGRRHPLKGVECLEAAVAELNEGSRSRESKMNSGIGNFSNVEGLSVHCSTSTSNFDSKQIELKIVSDAFGEEKERIWDWCDVLVLPTLSENFGLVVAEALERGKRVITTDGAPVWGNDLTRVDGRECVKDLSRVERVERVENGEILFGYEGRLVYLKGYREGSEENRVNLLKEAIENFATLER